MRNLVLVSFSLIFLLSCSPGEQVTKSCIPNHEQNGVGILLSSTHNPVEEFRMEICYVDKAFSTSASLYGLFGESNILSINTSAQSELVNFDLIQGRVYRFRFEGDEDFFAIFLDDENGNLVTNVEVMRGDIYN